MIPGRKEFLLPEQEYFIVDRETYPKRKDLIFNGRTLFGVTPRLRSIANLATDENMIIMNVMKKDALCHRLVCLLHEKPFAGVNGCVQHNNWFLGTDMGRNLLSQGKEPQQNGLFLLMLAASGKYGAGGSRAKAAARIGGSSEDNRGQRDLSDAGLQ